jgi:hypothetical protein
VSTIALALVDADPALANALRMWRVSLLTAALIACNPEQPAMQPDCSAQEAKIAALQARIDELTAAAARERAPASAPVRARPGPWTVETEESGGHTRVRLVNAPVHDDSAASLTILCQDGSHTISFRPAGGRKIPAGRYKLRLRFGGFGPDSYESVREVDLPDDSDTFVLHESAMEGIRTRDSLGILATATGEPQDIPHAIFTLGGIEEHLQNPTYAQACGR